MTSMKDIDKDERATLSSRLDAVAMKAADDWRTVYLCGDGDSQIEELVASAVKKKIEADFVERFEELASARIEAMSLEQAQSAAERLVNKWMTEAELYFDVPTERLKASIEYALEGYEGRHRVFRSAARQKKVKALALAESGIPMPVIAKELGCTRATAQHWVESERKELADLVQTLSIYGYTVVKSK